MKRFKATAKTNSGKHIGTYDLEIDTDDPLGEGDILILTKETK